MRQVPGDSERSVDEQVVVRHVWGVELIKGLRISPFPGPGGAALPLVENAARYKSQWDT